MNKYLKQLKEYNPDYKGRTELSFFFCLYMRNEKHQKRFLKVLDLFAIIDENNFNDYRILVKKLTKKDVFYLVMFLECYWRKIPSCVNNNLYTLLNTLQHELTNY